MVDTSRTAFTLTFLNSLNGARFIMFDFAPTPLAFYMIIFTSNFTTHQTNPDLVYFNTVEPINQVCVNWRLCSNVTGTSARDWINNVIALM